MFKLKIINFILAKIIILKFLLLVLIFIYIKRIFFTPIKLRGIVEGFYGSPWSFEDRIDLIKFCGKHKLNSYIYAPKNDIYHRDKWREPYPNNILEELKNLIYFCNENRVQFIFAVSPGLDLNFMGEESEKDFILLLNKLDSIYKIGCRSFAIFFDDIKKAEDSGINQAIFLNKLNHELHKKYSDIKNLITVPTDYTLLYMINEYNGKLNKYTFDFSNNLDNNIIVLFTGYHVMSDGISKKNYSKAYNIYKNRLGVWWNYPVNDYLASKLALGYIEKLPKNINYLFFNPMQQPQLSKISLATGADFSYSPYNYNPNKSWNNAIETQFGKNAQAMKIFASHSRQMKRKFKDKVGPPDAPEFYKIAHQAVLYTKLKKKFDFKIILKYINEMENSADTLLENLEKKILSECKLHLLQFMRIIKAGRIAIKSLQKGNLDSQLIKLRNDIEKHKSEAILSEESAIKFIDEVIKLYI